MRFTSRNLLALVIVGLYALFSLLTIMDYQANDPVAAARLAKKLLAETTEQTSYFFALSASDVDRAFADVIERELRAHGRNDIHRVHGGPVEIREAYEKAFDPFGVVVGNETTAVYPFLRRGPFFQAQGYRWSAFLTLSNGLEILNTMAVIAILAIGMTMVIVAGGIDLSVGRMAGLGAVLATFFIQEYAGARDAPAGSVVLASLAALAICAAIGAVVGWVIAAWRLPAFIVTLSLMLQADGLAKNLAGGTTIIGVPRSFGWLGKGTIGDFIPVPIAVMLLLYVLAHLLMRQTVLGRYIYAIGGNAEAARLAGVPMGRVTVIVYLLSAMLAGLGGIMLASLHQAGDFKFGENYELYAIAAVVIGGTSIRGGEGSVIGTFLGALLIAIIDRGMIMVGLQSFNQLIAKGQIIFWAVLLDQVKHWLSRRE